MLSETIHSYFMSHFIYIIYEVYVIVKLCQIPGIPAARSIWFTNVVSGTLRYGSEGGGDSSEVGVAVK